MSPTAQAPEVVRLDQGQMYDDHTSEQIDTTTQTGQLIQKAAESFCSAGRAGEVENWNQLQGRFRLDPEKGEFTEAL